MLNYTLIVALTIRALRELKGIYQETIARHLCVERSTYAKLESGTTTLSVHNLKMISGALRIPASDILDIADAALIIIARGILESEYLNSFSMAFNGKPGALNFSDRELLKLLRRIHTLYGKQALASEIRDNLLSPPNLTM